MIWLTRLTAEQQPTYTGVVVVAMVLAVLYVIYRRWLARKHKARIAELNKECDAFLAEARRGLLPIQASILLQEDEHAVLQEESTLSEMRSYRVYGGGGTRIGRVLVGGGVSEPQYRLRRIDTGTLVLTTKRLVFDGNHENRSVRLSELLSVSPWVDAIEVSSNHAKSQVFSVANSCIWANIIEAVATGKLQVVSEGDEPVKR